MVNVALIVIAIVMVVLLAVANIFILVHFQHPDDQNTAYFPKFIVLLSMTLVQINILMLPLDVSNTSTNGGFPMATLWLIEYILIFIFAIAVVPFAMFYYEAEDPDISQTKQIRTAVGWTFLFLIAYFCVTVFLYFLVGVAQIPVTTYTAALIPFQSSLPLPCNLCAQTSNTIEYQVTFSLFMVSVLALMGVVLVVVFGGIGFVALPIELFRNWKYRPKKLSASKYLEHRHKIGEYATRLLEKGEELKKAWATQGGRPKSRKEKRVYNQFRSNVVIAEEEFEKLQRQSGATLKDQTKLMIAFVWGWAQLVLCVLGLLLSIFWFLHLVIYVTARLDPFLNTFFISLDNAWSLLGTFFYGMFAFYFLWVVIEGNFKFGLRIPLLMTVHPMKVNGTLMNSFLFNILLLLLASVTVTQFCAHSFDLYARFTGIDVIFNLCIKRLRYIEYIWLYYIWAMVIIVALSIAYFIIRPSDKKAAQKAMALRMDLPV